MNTPRTDAFEDSYWLNKTSHVDDVFAYSRQLETELAAMTALADQMAEALRESRNAHLDTIERCPTVVREALAAYENHKKPEQQIKKPCDCIEKCGKYWVQRCDCQNDTSLAEAQSWCDYENHKKGNTP